METITDLRTQDTPGGNRIIGEPKQVGPCGVYFEGTGSTLEIADGVRLKCTFRFKGDNGHVRIGARSIVLGGFMIGADSGIVIGERVNTSGGLKITTSDGAIVTIGDDCLFAQASNLFAYDDHPIFDLATGKRINYSRPITIGKRVWVGAHVNIMGGSVIGDGSVIGVASVVTASHPIPEQCIAAGVPATVRREGIGWAKRPHPAMHEIPN